MNYAQVERSALCDTFLRVGPIAPTLCEGWMTGDLAAHLVIRDGRPDLAVGMFVPPLAGRLDRASRAMAMSDWQALVHRIRTGPPLWSPVRIPRVDEFVNTGEFFVHHEDVLRAQEDWAPRTLDPGEEAALWGVLARMAGLLLRSAPAGVTLVAPGYGRKEAKSGTAQGAVVITGAPSELLLFCFGRRGVAEVTFDGPDAAVEALRGAKLGF